MGFISINTLGLDLLMAKFAGVANAWNGTMVSAIFTGASRVAQGLHDAAPQGTEGEGTPPGNDAQGRLADSFQVERLGLTTYAVKTTQPTKLSYVRYGTGLYGKYAQRIVPTKAQALFWPGAANPYHSVAGQQPNDFVTPVLGSVHATIHDATILPLMDVLKKL